MMMVVVEKTYLKEPLLFNGCIALCQKVISNLSSLIMVLTYADGIAMEIYVGVDDADRGAFLQAKMENMHV